MVGPHATDLIGEVLGVKASEGTIYELSEIIQPHPIIRSDWRRWGCILWFCNSHVVITLMPYER